MSGRHAVWSAAVDPDAAAGPPPGGVAAARRAVGVVEVDAYAADCLLHGSLDVEAARLTDHLNAVSALAMTGVCLESLADGHVVEVAELSAGGDELCAVVAAGPRGEIGRRLRTHARRIEVEIGPYRIEGSIHGTPASDPLGQALRRARWVPLTDAAVSYERAGRRVRDEAETLLVNRELARSLRPVPEASAVLPWETPRQPAEEPSRALDLTGTLRDGAPGEPVEPAGETARAPDVTL